MNIQLLKTKKLIWAYTKNFKLFSYLRCFKNVTICLKDKWEEQKIFFIEIRLEKISMAKNCFYIFKKNTLTLPKGAKNNIYN